MNSELPNRRSRIFTQEQFNRFAALSGDDNPIHVDPAFSARTKFGRTVAHGMFLYANLCQVMGEVAPGALPLAQELLFPAPTFAGEPVELQVAAEQPAPDARSQAIHRRSAALLSLKTDVMKAGGVFTCQGHALLQLDRSAGFLSRDATPPPPPSVTTWKGLSTGQSATLIRAFTDSDLRDYLDLLGDANPLYTDPAVAAAWGLPGVPLPGPLLGALFSCLLGTQLPGPGTNWLKQRFAFMAAAHPGETLEAHVQIVRIRPEKELVNLRTWITAGSQAIDRRSICDGEALVWISDLAAGQ